MSRKRNQLKLSFLAKIFMALSLAMLASIVPEFVRAQTISINNPGFRDLSTVVGGAISEADAISADGKVVVGTFGDSQTNTQHVFRWTAKTGSQDIVDTNFTSGSDRLGSIGVSPSGQVIAGFLSSNGVDYLFRWTARSGVQDLGVIQAGSNFMTVRGVSDDGSSIAIIYSDYNNKWKPFYWHQAAGHAGSMTAQFVQLSSGFFPTAMSPDGVTIAGEISNPNSPMNSSFEVWTESVGVKNLGPSIGEIKAISDNGYQLSGFNRNGIFMWSKSSGVIIDQISADSSGALYITGVALNGKAIVGFFNPGGTSSANPPRAFYDLLSSN